MKHTKQISQHPVALIKCWSTAIHAPVSEEVKSSFLHGWLRCKAPQRILRGHPHLDLYNVRLTTCNGSAHHGHMMRLCALVLALVPWYVFADVEDIGDKISGSENIEDDIGADIAFVAGSWLMQRGLRLRHGTEYVEVAHCWLHDTQSTYSIYPYDSCCCDDWEKASRCWTDIPGMSSRDTLRHQCCVYLHGPGTLCLNRARDAALRFPGLPLLKARLTPSVYPFKTYFSNLLTEAHLLEPLHGGAGAPGPALNVVDIGAGKGVDSVVLALLGHSVVSLEQDPQEFHLLETNRRLNNVSFETVQGDLTQTSITAEALLTASGGRTFDLILANALTYVSPEIFLKLLDLIAAIGAPNFVWLLPCGREVYDLFDKQRVNRDLARARFELVDAVTFANIGNAFDYGVQMGQLRICALQPRGRPPGAWRYQWPRSRAADVMRPDGCKPPLWRCSPAFLISNTTGKRILR